MTNAKIKNTDWKKRLSGFTLFLQNIIKKSVIKIRPHTDAKMREEEKRPTLLVWGGEETP